MKNYLIIAALVSCIWLTLHDRWTEFATPLGYEVDSLEMDVFFKASAEADYLPFCSKLITRLGAPYSANVNDLPWFEEPITFITGRLANIIGFFPAVNLITLIAHLLAALSFYVVCQLKNYDKLWSAVGSILYAFTYYMSFRNDGHVILMFIYVIPFALYACDLIASEEHLDMKNLQALIIFGSAFFIGSGSPYFLIMSLIFMALAIIASPNRMNRVIGFVTIGIMMMSFVAFNLDTICYNIEHGKNTAGFPRVYAHLEMYCMRPIELLIPPSNHRLLGSIGDYYKSLVWFPGEQFSSYLGILVIVGTFITWFSKSAYSVSSRHQLMAVIVFSVLGGANSVLGLLGICYFRCSNRMSVFISCLVLLFMVRWLGQHGLKHKRWLAPLLLCIGLLDQLPIKPDNKQAIKSTVENDRNFGKALEEKLGGKMVFNLPVSRFPEGGSIGQVSEYDHIRMYLSTKTVHFSYGSCQGRDRENWMYAIQQMPFNDACVWLERFGFSAIVIDWRGVNRNAITISNKPTFSDASGNLTCVMLNPSGTPVLPPILSAQRAK